jgi:hypothetical protein
LPKFLVKLQNAKYNRAKENKETETDSNLPHGTPAKKHVNLKIKEKMR